MSVSAGCFRIAVAGAALLPVVVLAGCGGSSVASASGEGPAAGRAARSSLGPRAGPPTATAILPGMTAPGTKLKPGQPAVVRYATNNAERTSLIKISVDSVKRGTLGDFRAFRLSDSAKGSNVYYVRTTVTNTGHGNLGGQPVMVYGEVSTGLVVQPVVLGARLKRCTYRPLPAPFRHGDKATVCIVLLTPHHDRLTAVQWRVADNFEPISWSWRR